MRDRRDYCSDKQQFTKSETPGSAINADSGVIRQWSLPVQAEAYPRQDQHVKNVFDLRPADREKSLGQGPPAPSTAKHRGTYSEGERGESPPGTAPLAGWSEIEERAVRRRRMAAMIARQEAIEHWTALRCWRESGEELLAVERIAVLRALQAGEPLPEGILFFEPSQAEQWGMRSLCYAPTRDEVDWTWFPVSGSSPPPRRSDPPTHARAGEVLACPCPLPPRAPRREAANAPAPECRSGQSATTYPVASAAGASTTQHLPPPERTR